jgi:homocysteine S-methyltransferase
MVTHLPQLTGQRCVTDGGLETDLIFHHGLDLPGFAAFPLVDQSDGRRRLTDYYDGYAAIARSSGAGLLLESPTWRANPDWGAELGYDAAALARVNADSITFLTELRARYGDIAPVLVVGVVGPRGDGYVPGAVMTAEEAAAYHRPQIEAFAAAGADLVTAYTLTNVPEAIGVVRAARSAGLPVAISFTVETDGRLASGPALGDAIVAVDAAARPEYFMVNCAHPVHVARALPGISDGRTRIVGLRSNASTKSHADLDEAADLDEGDIDYLVSTHRALAAHLPALTIVGGCCGTDARHVAALWTDATA